VDAGVVMVAMAAARTAPTRDLRRLGTEWGLFFQACVDFLGSRFAGIPASERWREVLARKRPLPRSEANVDRVSRELMKSMTDFDRIDGWGTNN
jgi:hypothetical protein